MRRIDNLLAAGMFAAALTHAPALGQSATEAPPPPAAETPAPPSRDNGTSQPAEPSSHKAEEKKEKTEVEKLREQKDLLAARYELMLQEQRNELVRQELERQRLSAEASLKQAQQQERLADLKTDLERMQAEAQLRQAQQETELADLKAEIAKLQADKQLLDAQREKELAALRDEAQRIIADNQVRSARVERANLEFQELQARAQAEIGQLKKAIDLRTTKDEASDVVLDDLEYAKAPYHDGVLTISDRRIPLNGPIISGTADWVTERISYFNNESNDLPIFLIIDNCPGGSVMEGYRIVKAIEESPAPIHVVVKSFAASMAAVITTLADHSYAYPNAIILHHQMSSGLYGNMTQMAEQLENAKEWERRLAVPVAKKMGVSLDEFRRQMYEHNSNGDWEEFADRAAQIKWVNEVVSEIREEGVRKKPSGAPPRPWFFLIFGQDGGDDSRAISMDAIQRDEKGQPFVQLPPLGPFDHYFLYDPRDFYRY